MLYKNLRELDSMFPNLKEKVVNHVLNHEDPAEEFARIAEYFSNDEFVQWSLKQRMGPEPGLLEKLKENFDAKNKLEKELKKEAEKPEDEPKAKSKKTKKDKKKKKK